MTFISLKCKCTEILSSRTYYAQPLEFESYCHPLYNRLCLTSATEFRTAESNSPGSAPLFGGESWLISDSWSQTWKGSSCNQSAISSRLSGGAALRSLRLQLLQPLSYECSFFGVKGVYVCNAVTLVLFNQYWFTQIYDPFQRVWFFFSVLNGRSFSKDN